MSNPIVQHYAVAEADGDDRQAQQLADRLVDEATADATRRVKDPVAMFTLTQAENLVRQVGDPGLRARWGNDLAEHAKQVRQGIDTDGDYGFNVKRVRRILEQARAAGA